MERILVGMSSCRGSWEAWSRAISLAKRIDAKVYALLVAPGAMQAPGEIAARGSPTVRQRLELQIELAKAEGIRIEYFISEGRYEDEVIRFIHHNQITLLIVEYPDGECRNPDRGLSAIRGIMHRITCRVELVSPRRSQSFGS